MREPPLTDHVSRHANRREPGARGALDRAVALGERQRHRLLALGALARAQLLHELARVDRHRAHALARAVRGARLQRVVLEVGEQRLVHWRALSLARHLAADHDPLTRRRRRVAARAHRLAEAALHALGGALLDRGLTLKVLR